MKLEKKKKKLKEKKTEKKTKVQKTEKNEEKEVEEIVSNESILHRVLSLNLPHASMCRERVSVKNPNKMVTFIKEIKERYDTITKLDRVLSYEEKIFSRLFFRFNNSMYPFIHWRYIRRLKQCCKKRASIKLCSLIDKVNFSLKTFNSFERETYMPSKKLVEYFLIRLIGCVALNVRTYTFCAECFVKLQQYLTIGHNVQKILALIAATSRLWILHRTLACETMDLYTCVRKLFKAISPNWKRFPCNLNKWLKNNLGLDCSDLKENISLTDLNIASPGIEMYYQANHEEDIGEPV